MARIGPVVCLHGKEAYRFPHRRPVGNGSPADPSKSHRRSQPGSGPACE
jgi:hypothetical protein